MVRINFSGVIFSSDKPCETIDVTSETGFIGKKPVKPFHVWAYELDNVAYIEH